MFCPHCAPILATQVYLPPFSSTEQHMSLEISQLVEAHETFPGVAPFPPPPSAGAPPSPPGPPSLVVPPSRFGPPSLVVPPSGEDEELQATATKPTKNRGKANLPISCR